MHPAKEIRAVYTDDTIRVYQAYSRTIAEEAVKNGTFGSHFSMTRMTWIKPSFLWMMYRSGWAEKEGQEHILAIDIKRTGFDSAAKSAVISSYSDDMGISREQWQHMVKASDVRIQWDPEKDIDGRDLPYRSVQIGLRGKAVHDYVNDWIVSLTDITDEVKRLNAMRMSGRDISALLPDEKVYTVR
ncbi:MAG: DUF4291 domain-containing protein [Oscillospiraceae bacterium]|nr:DUF4291 domain-containing protein [Oscillospiraceae bacterium]